MTISIKKVFNFRNIITFLSFLILYFLPSILFPIDKEFYEGLKGFKLPPIVFGIVWTLIYICLSFFITYHIYKDKSGTEKESYKRLIAFLILNYLFMFLYTLVFFKFHNLFLGYIMCLFTFLTILLSMMEAALIEKKSSLLLLPYVLWSLFASVLSIILYLQN